MNTRSNEAIRHVELAGDPGRHAQQHADLGRTVVRKAAAPGSSAAGNRPSAAARPAPPPPRSAGFVFAVVSRGEIQVARAHARILPLFTPIVIRWRLSAPGTAGARTEGKDVVRVALVENLTDVVRWFVGVQHHTAAGVIGKDRERGLAEEIRGLFLAPRGPVQRRRLAQPFESTRIHGVEGDVGLVERPRQPFSRRIDVCGTLSRWIRRGKGQVAPHEQDRLVAHQRTRELLGQRRERLRHADAAQAFAGKLLRGELDAIQRSVRPRAPRGNGVGQGGRERWFLERAAESLGDGSVESCAVGCDSLRGSRATRQP